MIPDEIVREVRERASILEVVADYVGLKRSGVNYLGLCPFHSEKTPSFNVNTVKGIYHCFGCGVGGDVISFIRRIEGLTFPDAVKFLARRVGVVIPERPLTAAEKYQADEREGLFALHETVTRYYQAVLREDPLAESCRRYLAKRAVDADSMQTYRLGYAPDTWDSLVRHLDENGIPLAVAEKAGLIKRKDRGGYYDSFRKRLLFPIADMQGRVIGFGGRVLDDALPKYLNSPESTIYRKSSVLFGLSLAKHAIREHGEAFIVEGYFDHLALFQAGVRNVVATCGTALTDGHLKLLRRFATKAYLLFDADKAGKKATFRAMEAFLSEGFPANVVEMPSGEDPDTYLEKYGPEAFAVLVSNAKTVFDYFFKDLCRRSDIGSVEGKIAVLDELVPRLRLMADRVEQDLYVREIARFLAVAENDVRRKMGKQGTVSHVGIAHRERRQSGISPEDMLLSLMAKFPAVARRISDFGPDNIFSPVVLPAALAIIEDSVADHAIEWSRIIDAVDLPEERSRLASLLVSEDHLEGMDAEKAFDQCRRALEKISLREIKELGIRLAQAEPESDAYYTLLQKIDKLRARKSQLT
jgi:DNA primase